MVIGERLKSLREGKDLSQGDIEKRTGLLRCYVSRVENGHTVPSVETLEKFARAVEIPLYQLMYDGDKPPAPFKIRKVGESNTWESSRPGRLLMNKLIPLLAKMGRKDRNLILSLAAKTSARKTKSKASTPKA